MNELTIKVEIEGMDSLNEELLDTDLYRSYIFNKIDEKVKKNINKKLDMSWRGDVRIESANEFIDKVVEKTLNKQDIEHFVELCVASKGASVFKKMAEKRLTETNIKRLLSWKVDEYILREITPTIEQMIKEYPEEELKKIADKIVEGRIKKAFQN